MGCGEVHLARALLGEGHALQDVDVTAIQGAAHAVPWSQGDLHLEPHHLGDGPGQFHVEAGRFPIPVDELVGWVVVIAADYDHSAASLTASRGFGVQRGDETQHQEKQRSQHGRQYAGALYTACGWLFLMEGKKGQGQGTFTGDYRSGQWEINDIDRAALSIDFA